MIESYDFGKIVVDGGKFGSDVVIFPDRIEGNRILQPDEDSSQIDRYLSSSGIEFIAGKTEKACKRYNNLSKCRKVVAPFHLTC